MKKMLTALAATMLIASQAGATILRITNNIENADGEGENLHFFIPGHPKIGDFANKRTIEPGDEREVTLTLKIIKNKGPFYFARDRDLIPTKDKKGKKFIVFNKIPNNAYLTKMSGAVWYYNWFVENNSNVAPSLGIKVRRKIKFSNPWVKMEKMKFTVDGTELGDLNEADEKIREEAGL